MTTSKLRAKRTVRKPTALKLRAKRLKLALKSRLKARSEAVEVVTGERLTYAQAVHALRQGLALAEVAVSRTELANRWEALSDVQRTALTARARAEARLRRPDMAPEAVRARERAGADWETRHGVALAFAGRRHEH
jgi:hypothetical protein